MNESTMTSTPAAGERHGFARLGERLFTLRDYTPIPLIILLLIFAEPNARTATLGTLMLVAGELVRVYAVAFIGSVSRTRNIATTGGKLITDGPFAVVRNPLYVGNGLMTLGFAVYAGSLWLVILTALLFAFQYHAIVSFEETLLRQRFGSVYEAYCRQVPAWLPRRLPDAASLPPPPDLAAALRSEKRTLLAAVTLLAALLIIAA